MGTRWRPYLRCGRRMRQGNGVHSSLVTGRCVSRRPLPSNITPLPRGPGTSVASSVGSREGAGTGSLSFATRCRRNGRCLSGTMIAYGGLIKQDWKWLERSTGVFKDFLRLADVPDTAILAEEACSKVAAFARKWGPMWICRTPVHGPECYWRPDISLFAATSVVRWTANSPRGREPAWLRYQKKNPCQWIPMEEVEVFLQSTTGEEHI